MTAARLLGLAGAASAALLLCGGAPPPAGGLVVKDGRMSLAGRPIAPASGRIAAAALSPDGRRIAFLVEDRPAPGPDEPDFTSLWVVDAAPGAQPRRLLAPRPLKGDCPRACREELMGLEQPTWSLNGGFVYVLSDAWTTSGAVHQVDVATGAEKFVIDANAVEVLRRGPQRGMLLVQRHEYDREGAFDAAEIVRPDGKVVVAGRRSPGG